MSARKKTAEKAETKLTFTNVGLNDHLPYTKADISKISKVGGSYSISFYQLDYQAMATNIAANNTAVTPENMLISVGKIVMDNAGFIQFCNELDEIKKLI